MKGYDNIPENDSILLDLPFREATGTKTFDHAKPHRLVTFHDPGGGSFSWAALASGLSVLEFVTIGGGATDGVYLKSIPADTLDLDFTSGDFSLSAWIKWDSTGGWSEIIMGKYGVDLDGWEIYLDLSGGKNTVSQRHHHSSLAPNNNSNCYSTGWTPGTWAMLGISRVGGDLYPKHYRNGGPLVMTYEASGMLDPDTCNRNLVIGSRYTLDANWYKGQMCWPRIWNRSLFHYEWKNLFEKERDFFGV